MSFPFTRPRRLRGSPEMRALVRETHLWVDDFIQPLFLIHGHSRRDEIPSMPGIYQMSVDEAAGEAQTLRESGVRAVLLFGIPNVKDGIGSENFAADGVVQQGIRAIKEAAPDMIVVTDICLCEYTDHGHCGIVRDGEILNDETLDVLSRVSVSHAEAGADIVGPSGMIDGMVGAIRKGLDRAGQSHVSVMSYSVKYASAFYGPFRDAVHSRPAYGDRRTHQMDPANFREALREVELDIGEGADFLMVKPALSYLDVVRGIRERYPQMPLVAYNVSGEYSMVMAASANGWIDGRMIALEILTAIKRAGADLIITYFAREAAGWLSSE